MNQQQQKLGSIAKKSSNKQIQNPIFHSVSKEQVFTAHLSKLNKSRAESVKQSDVTLASEYEHTFQKYTKTASLIDRISETFDNGNISDLFRERPSFTHSQVFLQLPAKMKQSIEKINELYFIPEKVGQLKYSLPLTHQSYSKMLSQLKDKPFQLAQVQQIKISAKNTQTTKPVAAKSETFESHNPIQTKVDLLLNEIAFEKKRVDCPLYLKAMQIKLNEFIDYVLCDDDKYIGLALQDKANEILKEINNFRGRVVDGWLVLVLIEIFFQELKQLQTLKVEALRAQKKKQELKHKVKSQIGAKSQKSYTSSNKKSKYSEPGSRRAIIQEQQWIGALK